MTHAHRITTSLALLTTVAAILAIGQSPPNDEGAAGRRDAIGGRERSERYFAEDSVSEARSTQVRSASRSEADSAHGTMASWSSASGRRATASKPPSVRRPEESFLSASREWNDPLESGDRRRRFRVPRNDGLMDLAADAITGIRGQDPFVPAPLPDSQRDSEGSAIEEIITNRYQNPATVRAIRGVSSSQALQLFSEVSQLIDERSLEPTSYDVRVRRALRNLIIALDNESFLTGLGLPENSFQIDGFRNTLARLADGSQFRNRQVARDVLVTVMKEAQTVAGLAPGVVGFEFANAGIDTLDKFSGLEPADPALRYGVGNRGSKSNGLEEEVVGIGIEVREHADGLIVVRALRGGPAAEAGVETGDVILQIDGRAIRGEKLVSSVDTMKGPTGSQMSIRTYREGRGERDLVLIRRTVRVWTVNDARILSGTDAAYLNLSRFSQNSAAEMDQALNDLHRQGMKSLIIDLRGNPGGLLTSCVEISDMFVPCGTIVSTKGRLSSDNMIQEATYSRTWRVPVVILVDEDSASASEIFAAAVQENQRGMVVGTRSYGKGSVQTHFSLTSIEGDLRLTTALFYSPDGRRMSGRGVVPDVEVHDPDGILNGDEVLAEALKVARSRTLTDMAKAAGACRSEQRSPVRSSLLKDIVDPDHSGRTIL